MSAVYTNIYPTLKGLDANNGAALIAAAAQAMEWRSDGIARLCKIAQIDPTEAAGIIANARAAIGTPAPWFVQP